MADRDRYVQREPDGLYISQADFHQSDVADQTDCEHGCPVKQMIDDARAVLSQNPLGAFAPGVSSAKESELAVARCAWKQASDGCTGLREGSCPRGERFSRVMYALLDRPEIPITSAASNFNGLQRPAP